MYLVIELVGKGQSHSTLTFLQSQNVLSSRHEDIKNKKSGFGSVAKSMCSLELLGFCQTIHKYISGFQEQGHPFDLLCTLPYTKRKRNEIKYRKGQGKEAMNLMDINVVANIYYVPIM